MKKPNPKILIATFNGKKHFMTLDAKRELEKWTEAREKALSDFLFYGIMPPKREPKPDDNLKWAIGSIHGQRVTCMVDNQTMEARKMDGYTPLAEKEPDFVFERWATGFDL